MSSVFEFAEWTMVSEYDKSGQTRRYRIDANGRKSLIPDDYFEGWYLSTSPNTGLKWAVYVAPIQERRFRESLWEVATTYLEWFEDIFDKHSQQDRKAWSHKGAIGHRDLDNHVYSAVIQAAFRVRADQRLRYLGCSCITNREKQGDMIETMLGIIWMKEHSQCCRELMDARTHLEAACLGVEAIWQSMPNEWSTGPIVDRALMMPHNWYVAVPEPPKIYKDESDKYHDYLWRVELRCVRAVALSKILPAVIANYILCFLGTHRS